MAWESVFITFGSYSDSVPASLNLKLNGQSIKRVWPVLNTFGLTYDYNMKWDIHIDKIVKKTKYLVNVFCIESDSQCRKSNSCNYTMDSSIVL